MTRWAPGWWNRLSHREQRAAVIFTVVAVVASGYRLAYKPWSLRSNKSTAERRSLQQHVEKLQDSLSSLEQERQTVLRQRDETLKAKNQVQGLERQMVSSEELGQLLGHIAQQGQGLPLNFESMSQDVDETGERPEVKISLAFSASYSGFANFLRRIEHLSTYLNVIDFEVAERKEGSRDAQQVKISLRTPLRTPGSPGTAPTAPQTLPEPVEISRSPFNEQARPVEAVNLEALHLTGITWQNDSSTAIINDEVVRIGDRVKDMQITDILPDMVILSDGTESHAIPLNQ